MKVDIWNMNGTKGGEVELPPVFATVIEPELIKRAVLSMESAKKQPKGTDSMTGRNNTARYRGRRDLPTHERNINVGRARLPRSSERRTRAQGRVLGVPRAVGGPKAHPLKAEEVIFEKINRKERQKALASAIAATADKKLVGARHAIDEKLKFPIIIEDAFSNVKKTQVVVETMAKLHLDNDLDNAKAKRRIRAGKGKRRGRVHKIKKSLLIVTEKASPIYRAARNLPGVDVCPVAELNTGLLAPGALPGRLTLWTQGAIKALENKG